MLGRVRFARATVRGGGIAPRAGVVRGRAARAREMRDETVPSLVLVSLPLPLVGWVPADRVRSMRVRRERRDMSPP